MKRLANQPSIQIASRARTMLASLSLALTSMLVLPHTTYGSDWWKSVATTDSGFSPYNSPRPSTIQRRRHSATALPNGKVLVVGGEGSTGQVQNSAEIFDWVQNSWSALPTLNGVSFQRVRHTATLLRNNRVLVVGGYDGSSALSSAFFYDATNGAISAAPPLLTPRQTHTATLLADGRLLVFGGSSGGSDDQGSALPSGEIFDPTLQRWTQVDPPGDAGTRSCGGVTASFERYAHSATVLDDGRVLLCGGKNAMGFFNRCDFLGPAGTWSGVFVCLTTPRAYHAATPLLDGRVLLVGGTGAGGDLSSFELLQSGLNAFVQGNLTTNGNNLLVRSRGTATLLPNGRVLVTGRSFTPAGGDATDALIFNAAAFDSGQTGAWAVVSSGAQDTRRDAAAVQLPNGAVLFNGGDKGNGINGAAIYDVGVSDQSSATGLPSFYAGPTILPRAQHTATLLTDGRIVIAGGTSDDGTTSLRQCDIVSADLGLVESLSMLGARRQQTANLVHTGSSPDQDVVLVTGGRDGNSPLASAEIFLPNSGYWQSVAPMHTARYAHSSTVLADGKVLVVGGVTLGNVPTNSAELYNPILDRWSVLAFPSLPALAYQSATLMGDGRVAVVGGSTNPERGGSSSFLNKLYLLNVGAQTVQISLLNQTRGRATPVSFLELADDQVFTGAGGPSGYIFPPVSNCGCGDPSGYCGKLQGDFEVFDPARPQTDAGYPNFSSIPYGISAAARAAGGCESDYTESIFPYLDSSFSKLYDDKVLILGSTNYSGIWGASYAYWNTISSGALRLASPFIPGSNSVFGLRSFSNNPLQPNSATRLTASRDGRILISGGFRVVDHSTGQYSSPQGTTEIYDPQRPTGGSRAPRLDQLSLQEATSTGSLITATGVRFAGCSGCSVGNVNNLPNNTPSLALERIETGFTSYLPAARSAELGFDANSARFALPRSLPVGTYWARLVSSGLSSNRIPFTIELAPSQSNGSSCNQPSECQSGYCEDGFCCDSACDKICDACSAALTGPGNANGQCAVVAAAAALPCRPATPGLLCDLPELCDGTSLNCPTADRVVPAAPPTVCHPCERSGGPSATCDNICDVDDTCTGNSPACPSLFAANGTGCGSALVCVEGDCLPTGCLQSTFDIVRNASLAATLEGGYIYNATQTIEVSGSPRGTLVYGNCAPSVAGFGVSETGAVSWNPAGAGLYPLCVSVKDDCRTVSYPFTVLVSADSSGSINAQFTAIPNPQLAGAPIQFDASSSSSSSGAIVSYRWDFSDGGHASGSQGQPSTVYMFNSAGGYTVHLTVTDGAGHSSSVAHQIRVTSELCPSSPSASITWQTGDVITGKGPLTVHFICRDLSTDGPCDPSLSYSWQFSDGGSDDSPNPAHTFPPGRWTVLFKAVSNSPPSEGCAAFDQVQVVASTATTDAPFCAVLATPLQGPDPLSVLISATYSDVASNPSPGVRSAVLSFSDGSPDLSILGHPGAVQKQFTPENNYPITLTVTGNSGIQCVNNSVAIVVTGRNVPRIISAPFRTATCNVPYRYSSGKGQVIVQGGTRPLSFSIGAKDPSGKQVGAPAGMSISTEGILSWTPSGPARSGDRAESVVIAVTSADGLNTRQTYNIDVACDSQPKKSCGCGSASDSGMWALFILGIFGFASARRRAKYLAGRAVLLHSNRFVGCFNPWVRQVSRLLTGFVFITLTTGAFGNPRLDWWTSRASTSADTFKWPKAPTTRRQRHTATALPGGRILVLGGEAPGGVVLETVEIYDWPNNNWSVPRNMGGLRARHSATYLRNQKVLVVGGYSDAAERRDAFLFDAVTGELDPAGVPAPAAGRHSHTATLLTDGQVLVTGGATGSADNAGTALSSSEVYDPLANRWSPGPNLLVARYGHTATLLDDGRVLVCGGQGTDHTRITSCEFYTSGDIQWQPGPSFNIGSAPFAAAYQAALLSVAPFPAAGQVLFFGGSGPTGDLDSWADYNPSSSMLAGGSPNIDFSGSRTRATATAMADGSIILTGMDPNSSNTEPRLYRPPTASGGTVTFSAPANSCSTSSCLQKRRDAAAALLPNGAALITGGNDGSGFADGAALYDVGVVDPQASGGFCFMGSCKTYWRNGPAMSAAGSPVSRADHTATVLADGRILIAGGTDDNLSGLNQAQLLTALGPTPSDPTLTQPIGGNFVSSTMTTARRQHTASLIRTGDNGESDQVLVAGGRNAIDAPLASAEVFKPNAASWSNALPPLHTSRFAHSATSLRDGRVLVVGGATLRAGSLAAVPTIDAVEVYDPNQGTWSKVTLDNPSLLTPRAYHTATLLLDGRVAIAGGTQNFDSAGEATTPFLNDIVLISLASGSTAAALESHAMTQTAGRARAVATLLPGGELIVCGGGPASCSSAFSCSGSCDLLDPTQGSPVQVADNYGVGSTAFAVEGGTLVPLLDDKYIAAGGVLRNVFGSASWTVSSSSYLVSPDNFNGWYSLTHIFAESSGSGFGTTSIGRFRHTLSRTIDGRLLAAGGWKVISTSGLPSSPLSSTQVYDPGLKNGFGRAPQLDSIGGEQPGTIPVAGDTVIASGARFAGGTDAGPSPKEANNLAGNVPALVLERVETGFTFYASPARAGLGGFDNHAARFTLPSSLPSGWYWGRLVSSGLSSNRLPLFIAYGETQDGGGSCSTDRGCRSGHCVGNICCNTTCQGGCEACSRAVTGDTSVNDGICRPIKANQNRRCRPWARDAAKPCDAPDICDGSSSACPTTDRFASSTDPSSCSSNGSDATLNPCLCAAADATNVCDAAHICNGSGFECPPAAATDGTPCGPGSAVCIHGICLTPDCQGSTFAIVHDGNAAGLTGIPYVYNVVQSVNTTGQSLNPLLFSSCTAAVPDFKVTSSGSIAWLPTAAGRYSLCIRAADGNCRHDDYTFAVQVGTSGGTSPHAAFTATPSRAQIGAPILFDASESSSGNGAIVQYDWDFLDGTFASTSEGNSRISHTYLTPGTRTVHLTVTDATGATQSTAEPVTVISPQCQNPPSASINWDGEIVGLAPLTIQFHCRDLANNAPCDPSLSFNWQFRNGTTSAESDPKPTFAVGRYTVLMTAVAGEGADGCAAFDQVQVVASDKLGNPPTCGVLALPTQAQKPLLVNVTANFADDPKNQPFGMSKATLSFSPDGSDDVAIPVEGPRQLYQRRYGTEGNYDISLTAIDKLGFPCNTGLTVSAVGQDVPHILSGATRTATCNVPYHYSAPKDRLLVQGGARPLTFQVGSVDPGAAAGGKSGAPAGMSFVDSNGTLAWTPKGPARKESVVLQVTSADGLTARQNFTIDVACPEAKGGCGCGGGTSNTAALILLFSWALRHAGSRRRRASRLR